MAKKDYYNSDNRTYLISLSASIFTVILITIVDLIIDVLTLSIVRLRLF